MGIGDGDSVAIAARLAERVWISPPIANRQRRECGFGGGESVAIATHWQYGVATISRLLRIIGLFCRM